MKGGYGIGQPVSRTEDPRLVSGRGCFVDDLRLPGELHGYVVRSPHPHAKVASVDITGALNAPGVALVLTGADVQREQLGGLPAESMPEDQGGPKAHRPLHPVLATDVVRHVGDRVAFVVADTAANARDAGELVQVDYEVLPHATTVTAAMADGAPRVWDDAASNLCFPMLLGDAEATDAAFERAASTHHVRLVNNRIIANPLEPRTVLADFDRFGGRYTLYASTQFPHHLRQVVAHDVLHLPETDLRVIARDVGGGFGMKASGYPEDALVTWAAGKLKRPVRWTADRSESFLSDTHARDQVNEAELALDEGGRILGLRVRSDVNVGAYLSNAASVPTIFSTNMVSNVYAIPAISVKARAIFTHTAPLGVYRGAGRPEAVYIVERLLDTAARERGLDPVELRKLNLIQPSQMPYQTPLMFSYDSGEFGAVLDRALEISDFAGFEDRRAESAGEGLLRGIGIGMFVEFAGILNERMEIRVDPGGAMSVYPGTFSHGQGHETVYAQMVSDWLGVPFDRVRVLQGDTDATPFGRGTFAARSIPFGGSALRMAADEVIRKGKAFAAHLLEADASDIEFSDGAFTVAGTDRSMPLAAVARASFAPMGMPAELGIGLDGVGTFASIPNFPNGCHICEVEIDPETGVVRILRFASVDDVGVVINPMLLEGQLHGGIAQGAGQALLEHIRYDEESGQLLTGSFQDYCMPRADDLPDFEFDMHNVPTPSNPLGVKGAGEAGCIGAPPAIVNAILDALWSEGVRDIQMPATPQAVWKAIQAAKAT